MKEKTLWNSKRAYLALTFLTFSTIWTIAITIQQGNSTCFTFGIFCKILSHVV